MMFYRKIITIFTILIVLTACSEESQGGAGADVDLSNYYTKTEINELIKKSYASTLYTGNVAHISSWGAIPGFSVNLTISGGGYFSYYHTFWI